MQSTTHSLDQDLPQGIQDIVNLIGEEKALRLAKEFGGIPYYMAKRPSPKHDFLSIIGYSDLYTLCKAYAGTWLNIPKGPTRPIKKYEILKHIAEGESIRNTAIACKVSTRYVEQLRQSLKATVTQCVLPGIELRHNL